MDAHKNVLFRLDSWNIPGLKTVKILRTISMDEQEDRHATSHVEDPASTEDLPEAKATLLTTHKGIVKGQAASEAKSKAVVQVEVHCTPCSTFDDIIKQLEDPCLPTFKLTDLPPATKEDLYRISSPRAPRASLQAPSQAASLEEEIANFPLIHCPRLDDRLSMLQLDYRARSMPLPPMKFEGGRALFYPDPAPSMPLPEQIGMWPSFVAEQPISSTLSQVTDEEEVTDPSDERPAKRAKLSATGEKHGTDSSSDTAGSTGSSHRGKRLTCLKCGTHQTPQWRIGPQGPRTMCNACGVKYKKELKERERKEKERKARQQVILTAGKKADNVS